MARVLIDKLWKFVFVSTLFFEIWVITTLKPAVATSHLLSCEIAY